jgi:NAD(P)-dependent dehydrogenase (short-subunit alcohol dehydrogenase family)
MNSNEMRSTTEKRVLLVGGTGNLGGLIARALLERGAKLRLLVRPGSRGKLTPELEAAAEVVEDEAGAFEAVHTVVSAVQGGPDAIVDTQLRLLRAASAAGVRRFIPSDFSFNLFGLAEENISRTGAGSSRARRCGAGAVQVVHVLIGAFLDRGVVFGFLGAFDLRKGEAYLWGDGDAKMGSRPTRTPPRSLRRRRWTTARCRTGCISRESRSTSMSSCARRRPASDAHLP